ncbi:hypothetical protein M3210_00380 [Oceanobacillus luteolus]|uniref:DUF1700 domain-containing protein n=1 Tax=Oceanobacillus luteolus TaxID=1274358 RepID=A0ABW4HXL6_9BACI|nr:hypothetical protein [Oceanobacillus luteolus]MCM3738715.1 hypothetical protein [Oceanobacillus luteolus]
MEEERRFTIIQEIEYWKQHRLLPEHYCNYLLALYTNGEEMTDVITQDYKGYNKYLTLIERFQIVILYLLLPFSFVVIYFTEFHIYLQLVILALLLSYSLWCTFSFNDKRRLYFHSALIISLFLFLLTTILVGDLLSGSAFVVTGIVLMNFLLWLILGYLAKFKYMLISGIIGIIFVLVYYFL